MPPPDDNQLLQMKARELLSERDLVIDDDVIADAIEEQFPRRPAADKARLRQALAAALKTPARAAPGAGARAPAGRSQGGSQQGGGSGKPRPQVPNFQALLTAPYRFVSLEERVVEAEAAPLDLPLPGGFTGRIEVEWAAETPLLIGETRPENGHDVVLPLALPGPGGHVIPGATLRGLLRAAVEVVTLGRLSQVNHHHRYALRDFFHPHYVGDGERFGWEALQTGWLARRTDPATGKVVHTLTPCDRRAVLIRRLPRALNGNAATDSPAFHKNWLQKRLEERYRAAGMVRDGRIVDFTRTTPVRLLDEQSAEPDPGGRQAGVFVFSGPSPTIRNIPESQLDAEHRDQAPKTGRQKRREYVFLDRPDAEPVTLSAAEFAQFELVHSRPASGRGDRARQPEGSYALLRDTLAAGLRIPVFYLGTPGEADFQMGLTRALKIGHAFSVGEKLRRHHRNHALTRDSRADWAEALFGWVHEAGDRDLTAEEAEALERAHPGTMARRGRVAVGMARLQGNAQLFPPPSRPPIETTMMAPRASFAPFYLAGTPFKDWSADGASLAGRKRYFPRFAGGPAQDAQALVLAHRSPVARGETLSRLRFLVPGPGSAELRFRGEIRLHNMRPAEIGALLWVLTHGGAPEKRGRHMLGRGRPFGAGQMRVRRVRLRLRPHDAAAEALLREAAPWEVLSEAPGSETGWMAAGDTSMAPFLDAFHAAMEAATAGRWPALDSVTEWLALSDPREVAQQPAVARRDYLGMDRAPDGAPMLSQDALGRHTLLKRSVQRHTQQRDPAGEAAGPRLLAAPKLPAGRLSLPYRTKR